MWVLRCLESFDDILDLDLTLLSICERTSSNDFFPNDLEPTDCCLTLLIWIYWSLCLSRLLCLFFAVSKYRSETGSSSSSDVNEMSMTPLKAWDLTTFMPLLFVLCSKLCLTADVDISRFSETAWFMPLSDLSQTLKPGETWGFLYKVGERPFLL